ncbi:MAG: SulP family inorganic anion transporter [Chlamydiales bacterium]|nr:SulP family inorganic anion transporter [Chlamydiales bacterium]
MRIPPVRAISFFPFKEELKNYSFSFLHKDSMAALAVALTTIPQSIAYSLLAGLPPIAGLFSAIFGTIFTALFGSSRHLVSGPSTGVAILIQTSISDILYTYFPQASLAEKNLLTLQILGQIVLIMGLIQIAAAFLNVSKLLQFVSRPVILGYFSGIIVAILVTQFFYFFGIPFPRADQPILMKAVYFFLSLSQVQWNATIIGLIGFAFLLFCKKRYPNWPQALMMLVITSAVAAGAHAWLNVPLVPTLREFPLSDFLPKLSFPLLDLSLLNKVFPAAAAIALLAILEVFSISRQVAALSGQKLSTNQDVFGLGVGNTILSFISGSMPASGSASRTSLNYRLHAKTRMAAILSGLFVALIIFFCWPLVQRIPLAALAALLISTVPSLLNFQEIKLSLRATREDAWVFFLTFISCLIFSLDVAFFIGIVISIGNFLRKSSTPHLVEYAFNSKGRLVTISPQENIHRQIRIIGITGELYFASADLFQSALHSIAEDRQVQTIVLRLNTVYHMDASMCLAITALHDLLRSTNRFLVISGVTEEVWHVFHRAGLVKQIGLDNIYFTDESNPQFSTWKACLRAQELIHRQTLSETSPKSLPKG